MAEYIDKDKLENYAMGCVGGSVTIRQIHEFPSEDVAPVQKWIPVSERLPDEGKFVLVYGQYLHNNIFDGGTMAVSRRLDVNYWSGFGRTERITHWMPLPEPPKEGE